jgi:hypothetical protein
MGHWNPTPYEQRTDIEKIQSQWRKIGGLLQRTDWSAAVVRAATAAEIAVNLAIREEFSSRSEFDAEFVNGLLKWANGLTGKVRNLLLPLLRGKPTYDEVNELCGLAKAINDRRNDIAHRGEFCNEGEALHLIDKCRTFVVGLVRLYKPDFALEVVATDDDGSENAGPIRA